MTTPGVPMSSPACKGDGMREPRAGTSSSSAGSRPARSSPCTNCATASAVGWSNTNVEGSASPNSAPRRWLSSTVDSESSPAWTRGCPAATPGPSSTPATAASTDPRTDDSEGVPGAAPAGAGTGGVCAGTGPGPQGGPPARAPTALSSPRGARPASANSAYRLSWPRNRVQSKGMAAICARQGVRASVGVKVQEAPTGGAGFQLQSPFLARPAPSTDGCKTQG